MAKTYKVETPSGNVVDLTLKELLLLAQYALTESSDYISGTWDAVNEGDLPLEEVKEDKLLPIFFLKGNGNTKEQLDNWMEELEENWAENNLGS